MIMMEENPNIRMSEPKRKRRQKIILEELNHPSAGQFASPSCLSLPSSHITGYDDGGSSTGSSTPCFSPFLALSKPRPASSSSAHKNNADSSIPSSSRRIHPRGSSSRKRETNKHEKYLLESAVDDTMLAEELNQLTLQEREAALSELHGIAGIPPEETPECLEALLVKLLEELTKLPKSKQRWAWDRAVWLRPSLWKDKEFLIMFLRADRYDPARAAVRLCKHFHYKLELFGEERLVRPITMEDLNEDDMEVFRSGCFQILHKNDTVGRAVACAILRLTKHEKPWRHFARCFCYMRMDAVLGNVNSQIRGVVDVIYCYLNPQEYSRVSKSYLQILANGGDLLVNALPYRLSGMHFCYDDPCLQPLAGLLQMVVGKETRSRCRTHFGSHLEVQYALMTFGIPVSALPLSSDGVYNGQSNLKNIELQRKKPLRESRWWMNDTSSSSSSSAGANTKGEDGGDIERAGPRKQGRMMVLYPTPNDILLGRGRPFQDFAGNKRLAGLVHQHRERYLAASDRLDKTFLVMEVIKVTQENGGNFLQRTEDGWEVADDAKCRAKVSHSFRADFSTRCNSSSSSNNNNNNNNSQDGISIPLVAHTTSRSQSTRLSLAGEGSSSATTTPTRDDVVLAADVVPLVSGVLPSYSVPSKRIKYGDATKGPI